MDSAEALALVQRAVEAGRWSADDHGGAVTFVRTSQIQRLWGGMGAVLSLEWSVDGEGGGKGAAVHELVAKRVQLPAGGHLSLGDQRKKDSYECEARFFEVMAAELNAAGLSVPRGLLVEHRADGLTILMSKLRGAGSWSMGQAETAKAVAFLAQMHGQTWGARADAAVAAGLQPQGSYWYLDTRPDEWDMMPSRGWEGRLRRMARALDERLKADPHQCIVHGDTKSDNMVWDSGVLSMCDFQYCGKATPMKDLAYLLCCAANDGSDHEAEHLRAYLEVLRGVLLSRGEPPPSPESLQATLELSYCDLARYLQIVT